ncbi:hypothetical protein HDE_11743 [Halotydeus destructor]|nr:hypothetical protein HDE_11743 [Halotydeus destructor]
MSKFCRMFSCLSGERLVQKAAARALRKSQMVRIIALKFVGVLDNPATEDDCQLDGPLGAELTMLPALLGFNCTARTEGPSNVQVGGNYSGYLGELQLSRADFSVMPRSMPLDGDPCIYSPVIAADRVSYTTMYKRPHPPKSDSDLMSSFQQVDSYSWLAFTLTVISVYLTMRLLGHRRAMFTIVSCFFQYVGIHGNFLPMKVFGSAMVVTFYILGQYYSNFILSEIVGQEHPNILKNFFDILKPSVDIYFDMDFPMYDTLKNSINPNVRKVAQKVEEKLANVTLPGFIESYIKFTELPENLFGIFGNYDRLKANRILTCATMQRSRINEVTESEKYSLWVPKDFPQEYLKSFGYSKNLGEDIQNVLNSAIRHQFEHDLYGHIYHHRIAGVFKDTDMLNDVTPDTLCYNDEILYEDPDDNFAISLNNTKWLIVTIALAMLLATGVLGREVFRRSL